MFFDQDAISRKEVPPELWFRADFDLWAAELFDDSPGSLDPRLLELFTEK